MIQAQHNNPSLRTKTKPQYPALLHRLMKTIYQSDSNWVCVGCCCCCCFSNVPMMYTAIAFSAGMGGPEVDQGCGGEKGVHFNTSPNWDFPDQIALSTRRGDVYWPCHFPLRGLKAAGGGIFDQGSMAQWTVPGLQVRHFQRIHPGTLILCSYIWACVHALVL